MNEKNLAAIRAAALALVRQAELAGVVVTISTVPGVPLAMRNYRMEVDVRVGRGGAPVAADLSEQDAELLEQGASMLESLAGDERNRGNDSAAMGAECSAHAVRRLAMTLLGAQFEQDATCLGCGCTDSEGCIDGCWWTAVNRGERTGVCSNCSDRLADLARDALRWRHGETHKFPDQWQQTHPVVLPPYWIADGIDTPFPSAGEAIDAHMKAVAKKVGAA